MFSSEYFFFPDLKDAISGISNEIFSSNCNETFAKPTNNICSITYLLFTENNRNSPCYIEPNNQEFNHCEFDPCGETKILIHGYTVKLKPGNVFEGIKDNLLLEDAYNVVIVNWTQYNQGIYGNAVENAYLVGIEVGKFINFLTNEKGVNATDIHLIGHSLGAHVAGVAGKQVANLGRISGLDPAAPLYKRNVTYNRLTDSDAYFVDVIHTSNGVIALGSQGYGIPYPIGQINFYPNGGNYQPSCKLGRNYTNSDGEISLIKSNTDLISCRHDICPIYFLYSIRDCEFLSRECGNYKRYKMGMCFTESHPAVVMGLYAEKIPGLPSHSKFYLNTTAYPPYCQQN
ncbi:Endothelial lipase [Araneus ventricosus]|uniref:Endothelial lipase n=1 Tax=Araneus ventricosus TaxID=182803 RepID=A0A4Y2RRC5_ARAVE|nr:Endothelial lipase [Araneus ventricosus]